MTLNELLRIAKSPEYDWMIEQALCDYIVNESKDLLVYDCIELIRTAVDDYIPQAEAILQAARMLAVYIQSGMFNHLLDGS